MYITGTGISYIIRQWQQLVPRVQREYYYCYGKLSKEEDECCSFLFITTLTPTLGLASPHPPAL